MSDNTKNIEIAQEKFAELIKSEFERIERMKQDNDQGFLQAGEDRHRRTAWRWHWSDHHGTGTPRSEDSDEG
jgi:hypothetical protein